MGFDPTLTTFVGKPSDSPQNSLGSGLAYVNVLSHSRGD